MQYYKKVIMIKYHTVKISMIIDLSNNRNVINYCEYIFFGHIFSISCTDLGKSYGSTWGMYPHGGFSTWWLRVLDMYSFTYYFAKTLDCFYYEILCKCPRGSFSLCSPLHTGNHERDCLQY